MPNISMILNLTMIANNCICSNYHIRLHKTPFSNYKATLVMLESVSQPMVKSRPAR